MSSKELVFELLSKNNGVLKAKDASEAGINNKVLQRMSDSGDIEKIGHGLYMNSNYMEDEYLITQYRCKKGIFSYETALFFHDLIDRVPFILTMTIPTGYNTRLLKEKEKYKFYYINKIAYEIGQTTAITPYGNEVMIYDKERTICDCIVKKDAIETDLLVNAIKTYMNEPEADLKKLLEYAEIFKISKTIKQYMEMLL